jgi:fumarate hydratase subunit beta|uniref:Fe-S-containing hydro-lyase n=1 Tax=candidate division WOR-3 bacterium TaxID=2052148 RepID=A0A7C3YVC8_UNCW3
MTKFLRTPLSEEVVQDLKAGDEVSLSGIIYTARDQAHKRMVESIEKGEELPFELTGQVIYYVGPCPAKPGFVIGPCGPTTSERMDPYTPILLKKGVKGFIGKGNRSHEVREALKRYKGVYFAAIGGVASLLAKKVKRCRVILYSDLGPEAVQELEVEDFPLIVVNDIYGNDLYEEGVKKWKRSQSL